MSVGDDSQLRGDPKQTQGTTDHGTLVSQCHCIDDGKSDGGASATLRRVAADGSLFLEKKNGAKNLSNWFEIATDAARDALGST